MEKIPKPHPLEKHKSFQEKARHTILAVIAAFSATLPDGVEAFEFRDTSWFGGLSNLTEALKEGREKSGIGIVPGFQREAKWINPREGSVDSMGSHIEGVDNLEFIIDSLSIQLAAEEHHSVGGVTACLAHLHPDVLFADSKYKGKYLRGPSNADVMHLLDFKTQLKEFEPESKTNSIGLALETHQGKTGGWYFEIFNPEVAQREFSKGLGDDAVLLESSVKFTAVMQNTEVGTEQFEEALEDLVLDFAGRGVELRWTQELENEPPCAGALYESPTKSNPQ